MINKDSLIAEIRKNRAEILQQYDWSILKHHKDIMTKQKVFKDRLVTLEPKKKSPPDCSRP